MDNERNGHHYVLVLKGLDSTYLNYSSLFSLYRVSIIILAKAQMQLGRRTF